MYQSITIVGRLGHDPEMRVMPNGENVATMSVATERRFMRGTEKVNETTWFRVTVFGKQAETIHRLLEKGKMVLVEGRLRVDPKTGGPVTFTRQDGTLGTVFEIVTSTVRFLSPMEAKAANDDIDF